MRAATLLCFVLVLATGCASFPLPKTITEGDVTPKRKKRNEEVTRQFDQQRDFAEYEAAKSRWEQNRDPKGCREGLEKLLARRPQHREAHLLMAALLLEEDDAEAAYTHAKAALDVYPSDAQVQYTMALVMDAQGKAGDALAYYERATRMDSQSEVFAAAYQTARDATHEELRRDRAKSGDSAGVVQSPPKTDKPDDPQIQITAAAAALRANRPELAVELLKPAAKQFPSSAAVHRMLGAAYYRAGDYKSSQVALQQALSLDKSNALSYLLMGCALAKLGQNEAAEANFHQARTLDPKYRAVR